MKKKILYLLVIVALLITTVGCDAENPAIANVYLYDTTGTPRSLTFIDGMPRVSSQDYLYAIAEGMVAGHETWVKTGFNPNVGTTQETVWSYSTEYVYPVAAMQMEVVSSDNTQDVPGGTGALLVTIEYLDGNYVERSEVVALNGTTPVPTAHDNLFRINSFRCTAIGTNDTPVGNITLRGVGGGTVYSYILAGYTRARNIVYCVPEGKTLYITSISWTCADATKGVRFINHANYDNLAGAPRSFFLPYMEATLYNNAFYRPLEIPTMFPEHTDIKVSVISSQAGAIADVVLRGWLEED